MKDIAFLEYAFLFDPTETWSNLYQFEQMLGKYFDTLGFDATIVKTVEKGAGKRILFITKKQTIVAQPPKIGRPQSAQSKLKEMSARKLKAPALKFMGKK